MAENMAHSLPPLSLYIHFPWCVKKCPYCDFNSHVHQSSELPETAYLNALKRDLQLEMPFVQGRKLTSIFFGGGTPSLMSASVVGGILEFAQQQVGFATDIEITLEANPGTAEQQRFKGYRHAGVNRISLGVQSFDDSQLKRLGRIHNSAETFRAVEMLHQAGLENFNLDLMFALPNQTVDEALKDLQQAIDLFPPHLSWYQLTLEPNTVFYRQKPPLPDDDLQFEIMQEGHLRLQQSGFSHYETSAFSKPGRQCRHNRHYWEFGDYIGISAGAHGKITEISDGKLKLHRRQKTRVPERYLQSVNPCSFDEPIAETDLPCEFAMNALRLIEGVPQSLFQERTGLPWVQIADIRNTLIQKKLLRDDPQQFVTTPQGALWLNHVLEHFL